jgi:hypothetical protein
MLTCNVNHYNITFKLFNLIIKNKIITNKTNINIYLSYVNYLIIFKMINSSILVRIVMMVIISIARR